MNRDAAPALAAAGPQLCRSDVRHTRLRPVRHAFCYPVYQLRLPLRWARNRKWGNAFLSVERFNLLSFHRRDHGDGVSPLLEWIERLLADHGVQGADGEIWLQTFPRVLGFVFNPVSFWFCHASDGGLRAILCEVNNTFGERHCYLLAPEHGGNLEWGEPLQAAKRLHVSPFCQVRGQYRFRFMQAQRAGAGNDAVLRHVARIDYDDDDGPLLQTSIGGSAVPLTAFRALAAFVRLPLMTFMVFARIHFQALRLYMMRLPVFGKPSREPMRDAAQVSRSTSLSGSTSDRAGGLPAKPDSSVRQVSR